MLVSPTLLLVRMLILRLIRLILMLIMLRWIHYLGRNLLWRSTLHTWALPNLVPPHLRRPAWGGRCASLSTRVLLVADSLPNLSLPVLWYISTQLLKKQKINDLFHTDIVSFLTIRQQHLNFGSVISFRKLRHCSQTNYNQQ